MERLIFKTGTATYAILAVLSLYFYVERTAFLDIAFHLFYILKDGEFTIQNNRFGAFLTQLFPLSGSKAGMDLVSIMKTYSIAFVVYYYAIFFICVRVFKSYQFGLAVLLLNTLMVSDTFYWIQSELPQGLALMMLYFAWLSRYDDLKQTNYAWFHYPLTAVLCFTLVFFHPLLIFPVAFISAFIYLDNTALRPQMKGSLWLFFLLFIVKLKFFKTAYDSNSMEGIRNFKTLFPNYVFLESNKKLLEYAVRDYYLVFILFLSLLLFYAWGRKFAKLSLVGLFFMGYLLLVNVSYPNGGEQFYMENLYLPLSVFVIIPFVFEAPAIFEKRRLFILIAIILVIRMVDMVDKHKKYTERVAYLDGYINQTALSDQKKIIVSEKNFPIDTMMMTWASPYEIWLLSTVKTGETRSILITDNVDEQRWLQGFNAKFVTKWGAFDYAELPRKYFILNDSSHYAFKK